LESPSGKLEGLFFYMGLEMKNRININIYGNGIMCMTINMMAMPYPYRAG